MTMNTQVKSSNGITLVPVETRLLSKRVIFLQGDITDALSIEFIKELMVLISEDSKKPIKILINTPGGEVNSGLLIYDAIRSCETPLELYCIGKAFSMGAIIFSAGEKGRRFILKNSEVMVHEPLLGNRVGGNSSSIKSISESLIETKEKLNNLLALHTGKTPEEIDEATKYDNYFTAEEAIEFGIADRIVEFREVMNFID